MKPPQCPAGRNPVLWGIACDAISRDTETDEAACIAAAGLAARMGDIQRVNITLAAKGALAMLPAVREAVRAGVAAREAAAASALQFGDGVTVRLEEHVSASDVLSEASKPATKFCKAVATLRAELMPGDTLVFGNSDPNYPRVWIERGELRIRWTHGLLTKRTVSEEAALEEERNKPRVDSHSGDDYRPPTGDGLRDASNWAQDAFRCGDSWSDE